MSTRTRRRTDLIVGLTVLLGVLAIVAGTLWLRQADLGPRDEGVVARLRDVGSTRVGAGVFIRGVRAGRVEAIELVPSADTARGEWVLVRLRLDPTVRLPADPIVVLGASSLFGEWQVALTSRAAAPDNPEVRRQLAEAAEANAREATAGASGGERGRGTRRATIPGATLPDVAQLTAVAGRIADDLASVAGRVRTTFSDTAARELRMSIANVAQLSGALAGVVRRQTGNLDAIGREVRLTATAADSAAQALQRTAARVDDATAGGQLAGTVRDAQAAAARFRESADELRTIVARLSATQAALDRALLRGDSLLGKVNAGQGTLGRLVADPALYTQSDSLVRDLRALVADVRANPRRYLQVKVF